jgi:hypothetical protein
MNMYPFLSVLSGLVSFIGIAPYLIDVLRGKTKPRVASWLVWAVLTGIATTASFSDGQYPAAILAACMTLSCILVVVLGLIKNGHVSLERFDVICLVLSLVGLVLWQVLNSPSIAILAVVMIDAIAALPTLRHAWKAPHEETLMEFLMAGLASCITLYAAGSWQPTAVAYPLYIIVFDLTVAGLLIYGRRRVMAYNKE